MKSETPKEKIIRHFSVIKQPTDFKIDTRFFNAELPDLKKDAKNTNPPNYAMKHIFLHILAYPNLGPSEKFNWICKFEYKVKPFIIYDYKFDTWTLVGDNSLINEVKDIFEKAAELCDEYFLDTFEISLGKRECYIHNNYSFLKRGYDFFRSEIEKKIDEIKKSQPYKIKRLKIAEKTYAEEITHYHGKLRVDISYLTFGLISSFFSLTELVMEVVYLF